MDQGQISFFKNISNFEIQRIRFFSINFVKKKINLSFKKDIEIEALN